MFPLEQGAFEMLLIGAIALIVVGPKDLPVLMRKVGQFTGKMRGMAAEFRASFDEMARQSELDDLRKEVEALRTGAYTTPAPAAIDQRLYDEDQGMDGPPAYRPPTDSLLSPRETGGGDRAQHGEGGEPQAPRPAAPPPPPEPVLGFGEAEARGAVPLPRSAGEDKKTKPRAKTPVDTVDAPKPAKPRAPRKPKALPHEAEG